MAELESIVEPRNAASQANNNKYACKCADLRSSSRAAGRQSERSVSRSAVSIADDKQPENRHMFSCGGSIDGGLRHFADPPLIEGT